MKIFGKLKFQGNWRNYQERVIKELTDHLDDDHLHVVAAPGSGKTILGLEVMRQIGKPALILAPTITIRNQWIRRLLVMFLSDNVAQPHWISTDIRNPKFLTVITYQALHAVFSGEKEIEEGDLLEDEEEFVSQKIVKAKSEISNIIALLKKQKLQTIILDEAHHLRKEWWKALTKLKSGLQNPKIISLTATPPYDVEYKEWKKYEELCGPIDVEISIPELVKCGDLCPHQDYIYCSLPTKKEAEKLQQFKGDIIDFVESLKSNQDFLDILSAHPWVSDTKNNVEHILNEPEYFSSIIIFFNSIGIKIPRYSLNVLGVNHSNIPTLDPKWLEILLTGTLYGHKEYFAEHKNIIDAVRQELKRIGAIERRKVVIGDTKNVKKLLARSLGKLDGILDIARMEADSLGDNLRMVILADYIRKSELPSNRNDLRPIDKIGVVPIFEYLRRANITGIKLGILTGSLVFIPKDAKSLVKKIANNIGINLSNIRYKNIIYDDDYLRLEVKGENKKKIVHLVTEIFNAGAITVLVGTQALLGEGWDAPSVNALILASHVGSYMLSNQMRGRAIRVDPNVASKKANIWHLVAIDIETIQEKLQYYLTGKTTRKKYFDPFDTIKEDLGYDMNMIRRRFRAFEGISYDHPIVIENGFRRLGLAKVKWNKLGVKRLNQSILERAQAREDLPGLWKVALQGSSPKPEMKQKIKANFAPRALAFADTIKYMAINSLIGGLIWGSHVFAGYRKSEFFSMSLIGLGIAIIYSVPKLLKALYLMLRNGTLENSMQQVGHATIKTLRHMNLIKTNPNNLLIKTAKDKVGIVYCYLDGATTIEKRYFLEAMQEVLGQVDNHRYLLVRRSTLGRILRVDYHPVPNIIGQNKQNALFFEKCWNSYVGESSLVYTRNSKGRKILLQARTKSLASAFRKTDYVSDWS